MCTFLHDNLIKQVKIWTMYVKMKCNLKGQKYLRALYEIKMRGKDLKIPKFKHINTITKIIDKFGLTV